MAAEEVEEESREMEMEAHDDVHSEMVERADDATIASVSALGHNEASQGVNEQPPLEHPRWKRGGGGGKACELPRALWTIE